MLRLDATFATQRYADQLSHAVYSPAGVLAMGLLVTLLIDRDAKVADSHGGMVDKVIFEKIQVLRKESNDQAVQVAGFVSTLAEHILSLKTDFQILLMLVEHRG